MIDNGIIINKELYSYEPKNTDNKACNECDLQNLCKAYQSIARTELCLMFCDIDDDNLYCFHKQQTNE